MSQPRAASENISLGSTGDDAVTFRSLAELGATSTATTVKSKKRLSPPPRPSHSKKHSFHRATLLPYLFVIACIPLIKYMDHRFAKIEARINELKSELEKHATDGLGRVDYAMAASAGGGGGMVVEHSEPYFRNVWYTLKGGVHGDAVKMLRPSFGEPGACFCLKGDNGFVHIKLRSPIIPEAVTLEHVDKSVAYDSSRARAPKDCKVFGWYDRGVHDPTDPSAEMEEKMHLLTEFTYDLGKSNVQTFNVSNATDNVVGVVVDMIRLEFSSNHGSSSNTCIYRLRVHGFQPSPDLFALIAPLI